MRTKQSVDWQERYNQARKELHEAIGKYVEVEKELKDRRGEKIPWLFAIAVWLLFVALSGVTLWKIGRLPDPIPRPYPVFVCADRAWDTALMWQGRCRQAWEVLKDHHSGHYNGIAWKILDGQEDQK